MVLVLNTERKKKVYQPLSHTALSVVGWWWWLRIIGESLAVKRGELLLIDSKFERVLRCFFLSSNESVTSLHLLQWVNVTDSLHHHNTDSFFLALAQSGGSWPIRELYGISVLSAALHTDKGVNRVFSFKHPENFSAVAEARALVLVACATA